MSSSSSNRFAVLGGASSSSTEQKGASSSSKEQEKQQKAQGPVTSTKGTEDETMQDVSQAGSSMSLGGLESSLPRVPTKAEKIANFHKKRLLWEATELENERAKKSRQGKTSTFVARPVASAVPDSDDDDEMTDPQDIDCRSIINPDRRLKCFFQYQDAAGNATEPIGSIWFPEQKGWSASLTVDAGRYGTPKLSLIVRINKGDKKASLSRKPGEYSECEVTWRAGIAIDNQWVIETLKVVRVRDVPQNKAIHNSRIMDSCPKEQQHVLDKLAAITMKCNSARMSPFEEAWFDGLEDHVKDGLKKLFLGVGTHTMTIWFVVHPDMNTATRNWAGHLERAVSSGFPAFWQYMSADSKPKLEIDSLEPIKTFQKEMYVIYRPKRSAQNMIQYANGRVVEDKDNIRGYHNFEKQLVWEVFYEFGVYNTVPVIRDIQFAMGQMAYLSLRPQLVYLQRLPTLKVKDNQNYVPKELQGVFKGYVRQTLPGALPAPGAHIVAQWDNSIRDIGKPHIPSTEYRDIWRGTVMKDMEASCRATGTDFCVWFTKPGGGQVPRSYGPDDQNLPNHKLALAHLTVVIDETAAKREIDGMARLADPTYDSEALGPTRLALMSDPSQLTHTVSDLTIKDPEKWAEWERKCKTKYADNPDQLSIVTSIKNVKNKLTACIGPPGTGKTTVLADTTIGAVMCGHTTMVCAVSNNAVDKAANSIWEKFPEDERKNYKFLRYETASAEMQAYLSRKDILDPSAQDPNARPTYKEPRKPDDDDLIMETMAEAALLHEADDRLLRGLFKRFRNMSIAMQKMQELRDLKKSNVAAAMTLTNRMFSLTQQDNYDAWADLHAELDAYRREKLSDAELENIRTNNFHRTEAQLLALGQDKLDEAEIKARLEDGRIPSEASRNPSFSYRESLDKYVKNNGNVSRQERLVFQKLREGVLIRVMKETNVLFVTCNNAGSEMVRLGFSPSFINIDEAGQLTVAAFANVLTSFKGWEAVNIFGDPRQLLPYLISGRANEFKENAQTSALALLEEKGYPILRLVLQYRMAPSICQWVSKFFYKGLLKNHELVLKDNEYRKSAREICKGGYGLNGPDGNGSEYWMIDVVHGVSRVQLNGTSLQNHANAERIAILVDQALAQNVEPSKITVLVYYTGQLTLVAHKIEAKTNATGRKWTLDAGRQLSTVDSFQGEENEFVFIDIVVGHQQVRRYTTVDDEESEEDDGSEGFKRSGRVTAHVKSANRLCCALTRGRSCVVVVCQLATLLSTVKATQVKANAALGAMAKDFMDRKLVSRDYSTLDTSPVGEETRAKWDQARLDAELERKKLESLNFLSTQHQKASHARFTEEFRSNGPQVYRTGFRRTTRPNMSGAVTEAAETADIASGRNRSALVTKAGAVTLATGSGTQHSAKQDKKARKAERKKAAEEGAAEEARGGQAKGKGKEKEAPADPKGKGKEKEVDAMDMN